MKELNRLYLLNKGKEFEDYCNKKECEVCPFYNLDDDADIDCKFAFGVLSALGKIKMSFDDSEV